VRAERGVDAADGFRLFGTVGPVKGRPTAQEFLLSLNNTPTNVRSLGFDRLVGGIDSDIVVGHRLRPVSEADLFASLESWKNQPLGDLDGDGVNEGTAAALIDGLNNAPTGNLSDANGIQLSAAGTRGFVLNRRSTDGVVVELAPGAGTDLVWNFYAGSHDGTRRRLGDTETAISGELYTLDLSVTQVELVGGGSDIRYDLDINPIETDVVYLTAGLSFGSIDLQWRSWTIADLTNQLVSDLGTAQAINLLRQYVARFAPNPPSPAPQGSGLCVKHADSCAVCAGKDASLR
jgi:hypothetical protein